MPSFVIKPAARPNAGAMPEAVAATIAVPELLPRNCKLKPYAKLKSVPAIDVQDEIVAYASPELDLRRHQGVPRRRAEIDPHRHLRFLLRAHQGVAAEGDAPGRKGQAHARYRQQGRAGPIDDLAQFGATCVEAPSCASKRARYFSSSHEKVIVIDGEWCLVQSGNYSDNSIPPNVEDGGDPSNFVTGNRDSGLAIRSKPLARFFAKVLDSDIELELGGPEALAVPVAEEAVLLVEAAPKKIPAKLFPSKRFKLRSKLSVQPVLSPDNYMDIVPDAIRAARRSVLIEQQYIRSEEDKIIDLLNALKEAMGDNSAFDVRIILGKIFNRKDLPKERKNLNDLSAAYSLETRPQHPLYRHLALRPLPQQDGAHRRQARPGQLTELVAVRRLAKSRGGRVARACRHLRLLHPDFRERLEHSTEAIARSGTRDHRPGDAAQRKFIRVEPGDYREV